LKISFLKSFFFFKYSKQKLNYGVTRGGQNRI
jgi:hypothetical protein